MRPSAEIEVVYDRAVRSMPLVIALAACGAPSARESSAVPARPASGAGVERMDDGAHTGIVEGRVIDSRTADGLAAVIVEIDRACPGSDHSRWAVTDEHGRYRIEAPPGACTLRASFGEATAEAPVEINRGATTAAELVLAHDAVLAARRARPPLRSPSSPPDAIIEGHTTRQAEVDAVAAAVLERLGTDRSTMADGTLRAPGPIFVATEIAARPGRRLSARAVHAIPAQRFVVRPSAELTSGAHRRAHDDNFITFHVIDTDGTCAIVEAGPRGCTDTDLYEKRSGRWTFVQRIHTICS